MESRDLVLECSSQEVLRALITVFISHPQKRQGIQTHPRRMGQGKGMAGTPRMKKPQKVLAAKSSGEFPAGM